MALFRDLHEKNLVLRGFILNSTVEIERKIDDFLAQYFCETQEKQNELKELLFFTEKINFDYKREMLSNILQSKYQDFIAQNENFVRNLGEIAPHRNIFAHLEIVLGKDLDEKNKNDLIFKKYVNGKLKLKIYDRIALAKLENKIHEVLDTLDLLIDPLLLKSKSD